MLATHGSSSGIDRPGPRENGLHNVVSIGVWGDDPRLQRERQAPVPQPGSCLPSGSRPHRVVPNKHLRLDTSNDSKQRRRHTILRRNKPDPTRKFTVSRSGR